MTPKGHRQSGQILLISLLVISIAATVVLAIIGRTTTDVAMTNQLAESSKAFSAAEAGIEQALKTGLNSGLQTLSSGTTYQATINNIGGATGIYQYPGTLSPDQEATIWLVNHDSNGTLNEVPTYVFPSIDVCWTGGGVTTPAITVGIFYKTSGGLYEVARGAYDPDPTRISTNHFSTPTQVGTGCGDGSTTYKQTLTFANFVPAINPAVSTLLALRIQPVYASTSIVINSSQTLPLQGTRIDSRGTTGAGVTRTVVVFQQYRAAASIFDYVIYSQGDFAHY